MSELASHVPSWGLVFARCGGLLAIVPPLNVRQLPMALRLGLAAVLAAALTPVASHGAALGALLPGAYAALLVREAVIGLAVGFSAALVFWSFLIAGQLLDACLGADDAPRRPVSQGAFGGLLYATAAAVFVAIDGHHWLVVAIVEGFGALQVGGQLSLSGLPLLGRTVGAMLLGGVAIAAPALAAIYAAEVALASFGRLAPRLGLADVRGPVHWTGGLLGLAVSMPLLAPVVADHGARVVEAIRIAMALLSGSA